MEHTPKNVRYLRIIGSILVLIAFILLLLTCKISYEVKEIDHIFIILLVVLLPLSILAFNNAYYTFQFSSNINSESFDKWQLMQKRFWLAIAVIVAPFMLLALITLSIIILLESMNGFN